MESNTGVGTNTGVGNGIGIEFMVIRLGPVVGGCTDGSSTSSPSGYTTAGATQRLEVILGTRDLPLSTEMALHRTGERWDWSIGGCI